MLLFYMSLKPKIDQFSSKDKYKSYTISIYGITPDIKIWVGDTDCHPAVDPVLHSHIFEHLIFAKKLQNVIIEKLIF